ncbi:hypothetical protein MNV49_003320 [Pseudohyphozyma bogoriensis]|nr:hypothetical protein MNV49_003320 [Pseudohyphozyma bogoriensis]
MASTTNTTTSGGIMDTISHAASYVSESVQEVISGTSKEANKEVAKDSSVPIADRASAGFNAIGDKIDEASHGASADAHKEVAKH